MVQKVRLCKCLLESFKRFKLSRRRIVNWLSARFTLALSAFNKAFLAQCLVERGFASLEREGELRIMANVLPEIAR